jgi:hypothetical protein
VIKPVAMAFPPELDVVVLGLRRDNRSGEIKNGRERAYRCQAAFFFLHSATSSHFQNGTKKKQKNKTKSSSHFFF